MTCNDEADRLRAVAEFSARMAKVKACMSARVSLDAACALSLCLSWEQDRWLAAEQHRRGLQTRVDAIRAILDEARARG